MNYPNTSIAAANPLLQEDLNTLYKVYVGFEKDRTDAINAIEIIDGYLRSNESLALRNLSVIGSGTCYLEIEIIHSNKMNTFLRVEHNISQLESLIVKIFRKGKCVGYQFIDKNGNIAQVPYKAVYASSKQEIPHSI